MLPCLIAALLCAPLARAADDLTGLGLGLVVGLPTGLSAALRRDRYALDAALAWSLPQRRLQIHGDYLYELMTIEDPEWPEMVFPIYVGVGGRLRLDTDTAGGTSVGIRLPAGVALEVPESPVALEVFFEVGPVIEFLPATALGFPDLGVGARGYFF